MSKGAPGEWKPADATDKIRACAASEKLSIKLTLHADDQMNDRGLIMDDLLHLFRTGFVYEPPEPTTREGFYKYEMEGRTPNSEARFVRAVVIPDDAACSLKVVTVMWKDEK